MSRTGLPQECAGELVILIRLVQRALGLQVPDKVRGEGRHQSLAPLTDVANVTVRQAGCPAGRVGVQGAQAGTGRPGPGSDESRRRVADSDPYRDDAGKARARWCRESYRRSGS